MARAGMLTRVPCNAAGPVSKIFVPEVPREKSQRATSPATAPPALAATASSASRARLKTAGASILPLKWPETGRPPRAPIDSGQLPSLAIAPSTASSAPPARSTKGSGRTGAWPTARRPRSRSKLAQIWYQVRGHRFLPTLTRSGLSPFRPRMAVALPSAPRASAKPAPVSGSNRARTPCSPWSGVVGQTVATRVRSSQAPSATQFSTRAWDPCATACVRDG